MRRDDLEKILSIGTIDDTQNIYIWGTGNTAQLYQEGLARIENFHFVGYADNNPQKWGKVFCNKRIFSPREIESDSQALVLIASPQPKVYSDVHNQLAELGIRNMHIDRYIFALYKSEVLKCFDLFEDEWSKQLYIHLIECRINGRNPDREYVDNSFYSSVGFFSNIDSNEVFVDCGAYVGDTIEKYIWHKEGNFNKIFAFEPDGKNVCAIEKRVDRLVGEWAINPQKIQVYPFGVTDQSSKMYVEHYENNNGFGSKITSSLQEGSDVCRVVALDDVIKEPIGYLKADIESFEYRMLLGAEETIKKYTPNLSICIYHNAMDFFEIPLLISRFDTRYHFALRHYSGVFADTVMHAWVEK